MFPPIGRRTESDWMADGIRLDGEHKRLNTDYKNIIISYKEFKRHLKNTPNNPRIPHNFCNFTRVYTLNTLTPCTPLLNRKNKNYI